MYNNCELDTFQNKLQLLELSNVAQHMNDTTHNINI